MDMSWVNKSRISNEYKIGAHQFVDYLFQKAAPRDTILCPCKHHRTAEYLGRDDVIADLFEFGIQSGYSSYNIPMDSTSQSPDITQPMNDEMEDLLDAVMGPRTEYDDTTNDAPVENNVGADYGSKDAYPELREAATHNLYPGCDKFSTLSFIVKLLHIKCLNGWSNKSFKMLLELLSEVLPEGHTLPKAYSQCQKIVRDLGLEYVKIDACENNCVLFWKDNESKTHCPTCGKERWKNDVKKIPIKSLRYFPLKPRLQRLYMSEKTAKDMRWHHDRPVTDGIQSHPSDSEAWKKFDEVNPLFASDPRNVRLGLASDGMNPFGVMSVSYSIWPVILIPYNLPPWLCMKQTNFILSMIIPGRTSPNNNIDVYLQPLVEELKELWDVGVKTYDAEKKEYFQLRASLLWTINDFPAYGNLSGWSTKGKMACPICNTDITSKSLPHSSKQCYMGSRTFLPMGSHMRQSGASFDGTTEMRPPPKHLSGNDVLNQLQNLPSVTFGETQKQAKYLNWRKKSIFFELPYWSSNLLRHNLDVMHIEKNVCESLIGTIMNIPGKTKDNLNARLDLQTMGIRNDLHPTQVQVDRYTYPAACYTMDTNQQKKFCEFLSIVQFPDNYSSNISRCVKVTERKIAGLKSHDYHILLQQLLPIALRDLMPKYVTEALLEFSNFFKELCSKTLKIDVLYKLEEQIVVTLCKLEKIFPPSFFVIMMHLPIHLAREAIIGGPVQFRWMYPIERYLQTLKGHCNNKAQPEGSIAEGYITNECLNFCSRYLADIETRFNRVERNYDGGQQSNEVSLSIFHYSGRPIAGRRPYFLEDYEKELAHYYLLNNCEEVAIYISNHIDDLQKSGVEDVQNEHVKQFANWFEHRVSELDVSADLKLLARGPLTDAFCYDTYNINGYKFTTEPSEISRKTKNSGVCVRGDGANDSVGNYYGVVQQIIEMCYSQSKRVIIFKCKWFNVGDHRNGYRIRNGIESVNVTRTAYQNDPYILASQANQVFYVEEVNDKKWHAIVRAPPRNYYKLPGVDKVSGDSREADDAYQQDENAYSIPGNSVVDNADFIPLPRCDIPLMSEKLVKKITKKATKRTSRTKS